MLKFSIIFIVLENFLITYWLPILKIYQYVPTISRIIQYYNQAMFIYGKLKTIEKLTQNLTQSMGTVEFFKKQGFIS